MKRIRIMLSIVMITVIATVITAPAGASSAPTATPIASADPVLVGQWSAPFAEDPAFDTHRPTTKEEAARIPTAVSMAVSPDGKVIYWNGVEGWESPPVHNGWGASQENSRVRILDLRDYSAGRAQRPTWSIPSQERGIGSDLFCSDLRNLSDGRLMVVGGTHYTVSDRWPGPPGTGVTDFMGTKETRIYDPETGTWDFGTDMNHGRWYPSLLTLADGKMLVAGGVDNATANEKLTFVKESETFDPQNPDAGWVDNGPTGETELPYYARLHLLPNGKVFYDASGQMWGPGPYYPTPDQPEWNWQKLYDPATKTWTKEGLAPYGARSGTFSVMLPLEPDENGRYNDAQILIGGGTFSPVNPGSYIGTDKTEIVTADGDTITRTDGPALNNSRWHSGGIVLPSGEVLALNGGDRDDTAFMGITRAVREAEMFDGEKWISLASSGRDRVYHHTAALLADGSVLVGGHAPLGFTPAALAPDDYTRGAFASTLRDPSFEIFKPPYLFRGERPRLAQVQAGIRHGETFRITTPDASRITSVVLSRLPSVTHLADVDQRTIELEFTRTSSGTLQATVPDNPAVALPGHYYLFLMADNGQGPTPSHAAIVDIGETDHSRAEQPFGT